MSIIRPVNNGITQTFLGQFEMEHEGWVKKINGIWRGRRSYWRGAIYAKHRHLAIDYGCPEGTPVRAVHDGKIVAQFTDTDGAVVLYLQIRRGLVFKITVAYWHLKPRSFRFRVGDRVKAGQVLALSGKTGRVSGPHLHFEMWRSLVGLAVRSLFSRSVRVDPQPFIDGKNLTAIS